MVRHDTLWKVGSLDPRLVKVLTVLGFAVPVVGYLVLLQRYQVNAVFGDQWDDVVVIHRSFVHFPDWVSLWSLHNHNRVLVPNLIVVALAHTVHFNIGVEEYLSASMLFAATALVIWAHKRRSPATPLLFYCPVAFVMLSIAQWQNTLWGFQMAWYLVLLSLAATIFFLDRPRLTWPFVLAAAFAAVVGSTSSLQGVLIWPVGLVLLYQRRRVRPVLVSWIAVAFCTVLVYFHNFANTYGDDNPHHLLAAPLLAVKFFLFALGDVVGLQRGGPGSADLFTPQTPANPAVMIFGIALFVLAVVVLLAWGVRRYEATGVPIGIALILYGLLFDALVTEGRVTYGVWGASQSRYTTYDLLVLVGIYLTVLSGAPARIPFRGETRTRIDRRVVLGIALAAIVVQVAWSIPNGLEGARGMRQAYLVAASQTRVLDHEPNGTVLLLYPIRSPEWIRAQQRVLRQYHLSLYG